MWMPFGQVLPHQRPMQEEQAEELRHYWMVFDGDDSNVMGRDRWVVEWCWMALRGGLFKSPAKRWESFVFDFVVCFLFVQHPFLITSFLNHHRTMVSPASLRMRKMMRTRFPESHTCEILSVVGHKMFAHHRDHSPFARSFQQIMSKYVRT